MRLSVAEKKFSIEAWKKVSPNTPISWIADAIGLSRKCLKEPSEDRNVRKEASDRALRDKIVGILMEFPLYGYRKIARALAREGEKANKKRVARVMKKYGLEQKKKKRFTKTTNSHHALRTFPNRIAGIAALYPHHIWASDITYVRLEKGFCYVALIIDLFTRKVVGWAVESPMEKELVLLALEIALQRGIPLFHHSDRGGQYCAREYVEKLETFGVTISMADPGMSVDNPFAESMNKTLKAEEVYLRDYRNVDEARASIGDFIENVYNVKRLHASIGYVPPMEFERNWREAQEQHQELMRA